jgi:hypothetical protein
LRLKRLDPCILQRCTSGLTAKRRGAPNALANTKHASVADGVSLKDVLRCYEAVADDRSTVFIMPQRSHLDPKRHSDTQTARVFYVEPTEHPDAFGEIRVAD